MRGKNGPSGTANRRPRMAIDMGCKPDAVIATATELMSFVAGSAASPPATVAEPQAPVADAIAACGTAPPASETAGLVLAQPTDEAAAEAPAAGAQAVEPEAVATEPLAQGRLRRRHLLKHYLSQHRSRPRPSRLLPRPQNNLLRQRLLRRWTARRRQGFPKRLRRHRCRQPNRVQRPPKTRLNLVAKDLPMPPPTVPNGAATGDATSAAATAS